MLETEATMVEGVPARVGTVTLSLSGIESFVPPDLVTSARIVSIQAAIASGSTEAGDGDKRLPTVIFAAGAEDETLLELIDDTILKSRIVRRITQ